MGEVVHLHDLETSLDSSPERILDIASKENLQGVIVIGVYENGAEFWASSVPDAYRAVWMLERAKHRLLSMADQG